MQNLIRLQTVLAFLSMPALLGWLILTLATALYVPTLFGVMLAADSVAQFANVLAAIVFSVSLFLLGWWGWYSLLWVWFFYPRSGGKLPRRVFWGNAVGLVIVLVVVGVVSINSSSFSQQFLGVSWEGVHVLLLCAAPVFFLFVNIVVVRRRAA